MLELLSAIRSPDAAKALNWDGLSTEQPDSISPMWPVYKFLLAETHRLRGEPARSYACYMEVVTSLMGHPGGRPSPGTSLAAASLLRAARLLREAPEPDVDEAKRLVNLSIPMPVEESSVGIFELPVLGGLQCLQETLLREIALLAWSIGDRSAAGLAFRWYLEIASTGELGQTETEITDYLVSQGLASPGGLALARGKRFYDLRKYEDARRFLADALTADNAETRAGAGYYLARTRSVQGAPRSEIVNLLTTALQETTDPVLTQEILFYRATVFGREGRGRDIERFAGDLDGIIERFPVGRMADDALYELAVYREKEGDADAALHHFARLRGHPGPNDWLSSAYFREALIRYSRSREGDIMAAEDLLQELVSVSPQSQLGLAARFWLGRIASEADDTASARLHFESVIATCPYDYYAIRARMHLNQGAQSAGEVRADPGTAARLLASYGSASTETTWQDISPAHARLQGSLVNGFYAGVLAADRQLRNRLPAKQQSRFTVEDLDRAGAFGVMSILLALRQDVIGAATAASGSADRLAIASSIGSIAGDWPLAMLVMFGLDRSIATQSVIQRDPHYLTAAYPPVYARPIAVAAEANGVPPELLYAVIRRESLFYPAAVSKRGALGLFQFRPSTFETLDSRWEVLRRSGMTSMEAFLSDPVLSIDLGARWFKEELLKRNDGDILLAVMEHNAGYPAVKSWREAWDRSGRMGDVEYMIETAGFAETRIFARSVLADMVVAEAMGIVKADQEASGE
jgi:soluble lytic murein transglycosylase-like protein/tetratricopeptide (TPR) repeat protein